MGYTYQQMKMLLPPLVWYPWKHSIGYGGKEESLRGDGGCFLLHNSAVLAFGRVMMAWALQMQSKAINYINLIQTCKELQPISVTSSYILSL